MNKDKIREFVLENLENGDCTFVPGETQITVAREVHDVDEIAALIDAALNWKIVDGSLSALFEREMARRVMKTRHAIFCNSGSSANLLAFMALTSPKLGRRAIQPGDEVITSAVGFPTTVAPIIQSGAIPVFVDVSYTTYNPLPHQIAEAITDKTKAIFLAHTLGNPFDVIEIKKIAEQNELWLIEDCADAIGGTLEGKPLGSFGDLSTTSFYPAHMMTTGEGGMVFTDSPILNQIVRSFRDWGRDCWCAPGKDNTCGKRFSQKNRGELPDGYDHKYIYSHIGYNLKSTDLQASIGLQQLEKLPKFIQARRDNWKYLISGMEEAGLDKYFILPSHYAVANPSWFGLLLTIKDTAGFTRREVIQYLEDRRIATRLLFAGNITKQPAFMGKGRIHEGAAPKADYIMNNTFWIGCHPALTPDMMDYMVSSLAEFVESKNEQPSN